MEPFLHFVKILLFTQSTTPAYTPHIGTLIYDPTFLTFLSHALQDKPAVFFTSRLAAGSVFRVISEVCMPTGKILSLPKEKE
jgi:hypothetical protein